jgi:nucleoside-diphosphate-sugar epimerase
MILVTGGTGTIGGELLRLLSKAGVPARALVRNRKKAFAIDTASPQRGEASMARMSRFSMIALELPPDSLTTTSTMARAKSSARMTWLGNNTRNTG